MSRLVRFAQADFPAVLKWQALAFMKVQWPSVFERRPFMSETYPVEHDPIHFAIVEADALISYASIMRLAIRHADETFDTWAVGNVFTFPPYRRRGFARQVVDAATAHINDSSADVAILFCAPGTVPFYAASGWTALHGTRTFVGPAGAQRAIDLATMMLFVSGKGQGARRSFAEQPLRIAETW